MWRPPRWPALRALATARRLHTFLIWAPFEGPEQGSTHGALPQAG